MRASRGLVAAVALAAGLLAATPPAHACACGGVVDRPGQDTTVTDETALVVWDGLLSETIVLRLGTRSDALAAGVVIPTPTPANVAPGDAQIFDELSRLTAPRREIRRRLFGPPLLGGGGGDAGAAGGPGSGVQVLGTVDLGPLRATTLTAADSSALQQWLADHHFVNSPEISTAVQPYIADGWSFVAVQLDAADGDLTGELPPIELTFASDRAIYPMRMSAAAQSAQQPTVYVLAAHRMMRTDPTAQGTTRPEIRFAGRLDPHDVSSVILRQWVTNTPYLTATYQWLPDPTQIVSDFVFTRTPDDAPYRQVLYADSYVLPGDVGALLILLLIVGAVWLAVRAVRRRAVDPDSSAV